MPQMLAGRASVTRELQRSLGRHLQPTLAHAHAHAHAQSRTSKSSAHGENNIFAETGMGKPKPAKTMVHHPHHPGGIKANAMTAAQYEAKLGKDPKGKLLPKGVGYKVANGVSQSLYYKAEEQQARDAYLARHPRQAKIQAQAAAKDMVQVKAGDKKQSLYYKAEEQQARDTYLARHPRQAKIQAQNEEATAKDKAQVKAFDAKVKETN
jgi:hypothetical protein